MCQLHWPFYNTNIVVIEVDRNACLNLLYFQSKFRFTGPREAARDSAFRLEETPLFAVWEKLLAEEPCDPAPDVAPHRDALSLQRVWQEVPRGDFSREARHPAHGQPTVPLQSLRQEVHTARGADTPQGPARHPLECLPPRLDTFSRLGILGNSLPSSNDIYFMGTFFLRELITLRCLNVSVEATILQFIVINVQRFINQYYVNFGSVFANEI